VHFKQKKTFLRWRSD